RARNKSCRRADSRVTSPTTFFALDWTGLRRLKGSTPAIGKICPNSRRNSLVLRLLFLLLMGDGS
ncbi:hypothetical protein PFISCL1PPCAC_6759, partial [Pristionchus fissidentatus]